jgi:hypothetical protein
MEGNKATQAEFRPAAALQYGTPYTITLDGELTDSQGDALPSPSGPLTFSAPPPISTVYPINYGVSPGESEIRITFSVPMHHPSTESAFSIAPQAAGEFEWRENVLVYVLAEKLDSYTTYTVSLAPTATDAERKPILVDAYSWSFETDWDGYDESDTTSFGVYGPNVQVVDADGRRAVHLSVGEQELTLDFAVYELDLTAYASHYATEFGYTSWGTDAPIDTQELAATESWQVTYPASGIQEVILPPEVAPGLYILTVSSGDTKKDQLFLAVTRNALVVKRAGDNLFVWASDVNGEAVAGIEVRLYSTRGENLRECQTDENGVYRTTVPDGYEPLFVAARGEQGDVSIAGFDYAWKSYGENFWISASGIPDRHLHTDRPITAQPDHVFQSRLAPGPGCPLLSPSNGHAGHGSHPRCAREHHPDARAGDQQVWHAERRIPHRPRRCVGRLHH